MVQVAKRTAPVCLIKSQPRVTMSMEPVSAFLDTREPLVNQVEQSAGTIHYSYLMVQSGIFTKFV